MLRKRFSHSRREENVGLGAVWPPLSQACFVLPDKFKKPREIDD